MSTLNEAELFGAVGEHLAQHGSIRLQDVVAKTGVSIGSLYHRYGSREALLAQAWLDAVTAFQTRFLAELESGKRDAGERAAMVTPRFCRDDIDRARLLICCRQEELISDSIPRDLAADIKSVNVTTRLSILKFAKMNGYALEACHLGLIAYPLGAARLYLPNKHIPESVDNYIAAAFRSVVTLAA